MQQIIRRSCFRACCAALSIAGSLAFASGSSASGSAPSTPKPPPPSEATSFGKSADSTAVPGRADAEKSYAKGWEMVGEAKKELTDGKADSAKKRFGKALKKFREAVEIDPSYYQGWNMVGYCSRKSGDLKGAFVAYRKCLEIEPEYAEAHEYLGEAYLMSGDVAKAKEQLLWLVSRKSDLSGELIQKIEAFQKDGTSTSRSDSTAQGGW